MAGRRSCIKDTLLSLIDDIELVAKELLENAIAERHQKLSSSDQLLTTELLVMKDRKLKVSLQMAADQAKTHYKIEALRGEVDRLDRHIQQFQCHLKKCEEILATAVFQARQVIAIDNKHPVASEDIIKFTFGISASNGVCGPLTWQPGDRRRPYPTDLEMRSGHLGGFPIEQLPLQQNLFICHPSGEIYMTVGGQGTVTDTQSRSKDAEDVEVMSTDTSSGSSSSSSSDSE